MMIVNENPSSPVAKRQQSTVSINKLSKTKSIKMQQDVSLDGKQQIWNERSNNKTIESPIKIKGKVKEGKSQTRMEEYKEE